MHTPKSWYRYCGRIKPVASPFIILVTFGSAEFVYDISNTGPINGEKDKMPETVSAEYLSSYFNSNKSLQNISLKTIFNMANHIEKMGLDGFGPKKKYNSIP